MSTRRPTRIALVLGCFAAVASAQGALSTQSRSFHTGDVVSTAAYRPESMALVDLDNDGRPEIVCAHQGNFQSSARISVQHNETDGTFAAPISYPAGGETMDVVGGDFDGDGWNDVAFTRTSNSFSGQQVIVLMNDGAGLLMPWVAYACGRGPTSMVTFDVEGDGDLDLVTANSYWSEGDVSVLLNDGQGQFTIRNDYPLGTGTDPWRIAAGDIDGDGDIDVATTFRDGAPGVCILRNNGQGQFQNPQVLPSPVPFILAVPGLAIADVDLDGDQDVVYASSGQSGYALFRNGGAGNFAPALHIGGNVHSGSANDLAVADVTLDGWPDVLGVGYSDKYGFALVPGDGAGGFGSGTTLRAGEMSRSIEVGDVDLDGDPDVLVVNHGSLNVTVHRNTVGQFELPDVVGIGMSAVTSTVGDLDRDGDLDAVAADTQIYRLLNDGSGNLTSFPGGTSPGGIFAYPELADFDGDQFVDLIALRSGLVFCRNDGGGGLLPPTAIAGGSGLKQAKPVDFDGDGLMDIVSTAQGSFGSPNLYAIRNLGNGLWSTPIPSTNTTITQGSKLVCGDLNGDLFPDVVTGQGGALGVWIGAGGGAFTLASTPTLGNGGASYLSLGDLDGDGDLDAVAASIAGPSGPSVTVLKNNGSGAFGAPTTYISLFSLQYSGVAGLSLVDVEHDGDLDIVAGSYGGNGVSLFENLGSGQFAAEDRYGVAGAVLGVIGGDFDGDGRCDVLVNLGTEPPISGGVSVLFGRPYDAPFTVYCVAKVASTGCVPSIWASGAASATASSGFVVRSTNTRNNKVGILLNGISGRQALPFGGGTLCLSNPRRAPAFSSGGSPAPINDCSGVHQVDMNAYARGLLPNNPWPQMSTPGTLVQCQFWARDPGFIPPDNVSLSNALEYTVGP